ncbi:MAG: hypothetical protein NVS4B2_18620 [Chloroflexota bacterium]
MLVLFAASTQAVMVQQHSESPGTVSVAVAREPSDVGATPAPMPTIDIPRGTPVTIPTLTIPTAVPSMVATLVLPHPVPQSRAPKARHTPHRVIPAKKHSATTPPQGQWIWAYLTSYCPGSAGAISSSGVPVFFGMLANNYFPFGTRVYLPVLGMTGVVEDRVGTLALWNHFDVWSPTCFGTPTGYFRVAVQARVKAPVYAASFSSPRSSTSSASGE